MIYKGQKTTPEFHFIKPIMESWANLYEKAAEAFPQKDNFWFSERGHVSMLCAASWLTDVPALTEVKTKKRGSNSGHADILLETGDMKIVGEANMLIFPTPGTLLLRCMN